MKMKSKILCLGNVELLKCDILNMIDLITKCYASFSSMTDVNSNYTAAKKNFFEFSSYVVVPLSFEN